MDQRFFVFFYSTSFLNRFVFRGIIYIGDIFITLRLMPSQSQIIGSTEQNEWISVSSFHATCINNDCFELSTLKIGISLYICRLMSVLMTKHGFFERSFPTILTFHFKLNRIPHIENAIYMKWRAGMKWPHIELKTKIKKYLLKWTGIRSSSSFVSSRVRSVWHGCRWCSDNKTVCLSFIFMVEFLCYFLPVQTHVFSVQQQHVVLSHLQAMFIAHTQTLKQQKTYRRLPRN